MKISKQELLKALQRALPGVETGSSLLEGADTFIFQDGFCYTYNDSISVRVHVPGELVGAVKATEFFKLLSKLSNDEIEVNIQEKVWLMKCGQAEVEMSLLQAGVMNQISTLLPETEWKTIPEDFMAGVGECKFSCNRSSLSGIFVSDKYIFSTDEIRLNRCLITEPMKQFWISDAAAGELLKLNGLIEYNVDNAWVHFRTAESTVFSIKKLADDKFPLDKLNSVISSHEPTVDDVTITLPANLKDSVERASALSMDIDSQASVKLELNKQGIVVSTSRSTGKFKEKIEWVETPPDNFPEVQVFIDYSMIVYGLKRSANLFTRTTESAGGNKLHRLVFHSPKVIHIISTKSAE